MPPHVLVLDADASAAQVTRAGVARVLPDATLAVEANAEKGWQSAQAHWPDVLIIDPAPHNMASAWFIQAFKSAQPNGVVIVLASAPTPTLRRTMHRLGVDVYLEKPVTLRVLQHEVKAALHLHRTASVHETKQDLKT